MCVYIYVYIYIYLHVCVEGGGRKDYKNMNYFTYICIAR